MRIGVDLMGSEKNPQEYLLAILELSKQLPKNRQLTLIATHDVVQSLSAPIDTVVVEEVILMKDPPLKAVRQKRKSNIVKGIQLLREGRIDALVTAANTGALIAACTLGLPFLNGFKRPALLAMLPRKKGSFSLLDVGGHVFYKPENIVQFAILGAVYQRVTKQISSPLVGLLNIGQEVEKGTKGMRFAHQMLKESSKKYNFNFVGNIEGSDVFHSNLDVLVTDGFTGNVFLKTIEGFSAYMIEELERWDQNLPIDCLKKRFFHAYYPGAVVCGVEGLVMKCHGASSAKGFIKCVESAFEMVSFGLVNKMKEGILY